MPAAVGQPGDRPVEGDEVLQAHIDADGAAVALDRCAGVTQPRRAVEHPQSQRRLPPATLVLDRQSLDLGPARGAKLPHLTDRVGLVGVQPGDLGTAITSGNLLRLRAGVPPFPGALAGTSRQHRPNVLMGGGPDPVAVIDAVGELDERDRLTRVAIDGSSVTSTARAT